MNPHAAGDHDVSHDEKRYSAVIPTRIATAFGLVFVVIVNLVGATCFARIGRPRWIPGWSHPVATNASFLVPAEFTFAMWGLAVYVIWQLLPSTYGLKTINECVGLSLFLNSAGNIAWVIAWRAGYNALSVIFMGCTILTAFIAWIRLKALAQKGKPLRHVYWTTHFPISMCMAWLVGVGFASVSVAIPDPQPRTTGLVVLIVQACTGLALSAWAGDAIVAGVSAWTLIGLHVANRGVPLLESVSMCLAAAMAVASLVLGVRAWYRHPATTAMDKDQQFTQNNRSETSSIPWSR